MEITNSGKVLMKTLAAMGGWYDCPKDPEGKRLGPLVGYAARYADKEGPDDVSLQYVGDTYVNCAVLEEEPLVLQEIVFEHLTPIVEEFSRGFRDKFSGGRWAFCGAPEGGKAIALLLAMFFKTRYIFPEKKAVKIAGEGSREETKLVWGRHRPRSLDNVVIVEDLLNNFSTTEEIKKITREAGAKVYAIVSLVNRSLKFEDLFMGDDNCTLPILSIFCKPIPQYKQSDPEVADDIKKRNVVWKAKDEWPRLQEAMETASS